jgi:hypothetical protein
MDSKPGGSLRRGTERAIARNPRQQTTDGQTTDPAKYLVYLSLLSERLLSVVQVWRMPESSHPDKTPNVSGSGQASKAWERNPTRLPRFWTFTCTG